MRGRQTLDYMVCMDGVEESMQTSGTAALTEAKRLKLENHDALVTIVLVEAEA